MASVLEAALGRYRAVSLAALIALPLMAWAWLLAGANMGMDPLVSLSPIPARDPHMPGMIMEGAMPWSAERFVLTLSMWWVMMVAMMLPSAAPTILLYVRAAVLRQAEVRPSPDSFLAGYLVVWGSFSLFATILHLLLDRVGLLVPNLMASQSRWLSVTILFAVGLYQLSPFKNVCLRQCRNPAQFLSRHYRSGRLGALRMGLLHGAFCVGCCWLLMALLFVGGVMNLLWIALLTMIVAAEKLLPSGRFISLATGLACIAWGTAMLLS